MELHSKNQSEAINHLTSKKQLQSNLSQIYSNQLVDTKNTKESQRKTDLNFEKSQLQANSSQIQKEIEEKARNKLQYSQIAKEQTELWLAKLKSLQDKVEQEKREYQELCKRSILRDKIKEENYRNYYKSVAEDIMEKEEQFKRGISSVNPNEYKGKSPSKSNSNSHSNNQDSLYFPSIQRQNIVKAMETQTLKDNLASSSLTKPKDKVSLYKARKADFYRNDFQGKSLPNSNLGVDYGKSNKDFYKSLLDKQSDEIRDLKSREKRMTREEKKLNVMDLQAYKEHDTSLYSMIPGYSAQVGAYSRRGMGAGGYRDQKFKENVLKSQMGGSNYWSPQYEKKSYGNLENRDHNSSYNSGFLLEKKHNPITNPLPFNIQNPYILKELSWIGGNSRP